MPSASSICFLPSRSRYSALMRAGRSTSSQISGTDRQPSSNAAFSSDAQRILGLMKARGILLALLLVQVDHDHALGHADLDGGQADAVGRVHALGHVVDQLADFRIHLLDILETALRRGSGAVRMGRTVMGWK